MRPHFQRSSGDRPSRRRQATGQSQASTARLPVRRRFALALRLAVVRSARPGGRQPALIEPQSSSTLIRHAHIQPRATWYTVPWPARVCDGARSASFPHAGSCQAIEVSTHPSSLRVPEMKQHRGPPAIHTLSNHGRSDLSSQASVRGVKLVLPGDLGAAGKSIGAQERTNRSLVADVRPRQHTGPAAQGGGGVRVVHRAQAWRNQTIS